MLLFFASHLKISNVGSNSSNKYKKPYLNAGLLLVALTLLVIIPSFNVSSPDYLPYSYIIKEVGNLESFFFKESTAHLHGDFTFFLISAISNTLGLSTSFTFFIVALISVLCVLFVGFKRSDFIFLTVLIYFSHSYLNKEMIQIRAGLASGFLLLSLHYLSQASKGKGRLTLIASFLSHSSALMALFPLFFAHIVKPTYMKKLFQFSLFISIFLGSLGMVNLISGTLNWFLPTSVTQYLQWDRYNYELSFFNPGILRAILFSLLIIRVFSVLATNRFYYISCVFFVFATCFLVSFKDVAIIASRVSSLLFCVESIIMPRVFVLNFGKVKGVFFLLLFCFILFFQNVLFKGLGEVELAL